MTGSTTDIKETYPGHLLPSPHPLPPKTSARWPRVLAAIYDPFFAMAERAGLRDRRRSLLARARGRVIEVGAGTGLNLKHYPATLTDLMLVEPEASMAVRLADRCARSRGDARVVRAYAEALPVADASVDTAVVTFTLCSVTDPTAALAELVRVLRPGGRLLLLEHVRADSPARARIQDVLAPAWRAFACGCRCNQATPALIAGCEELDVERSTPFAMRRMPGIVRPAVEVVAVRR